MKRRTIFLAGILLLAMVAQGPAVAGARNDDAMVAGAGAGVFPAGATFAGLTLSALQFGQGVLTDGGSTSGVFHAVLIGTSVLGRAQQITVEGKVEGGLLDGNPSFNGIAKVDMGFGDLPLVDAPFSVTVSSQSLQLTLAGTALPAAVLSAGAIAIE